MSVLNYRYSRQESLGHQMVLAKYVGSVEEGLLGGGRERRTCVHLLCSFGDKLALRYNLHTANKLPDLLEQNCLSYLLPGMVGLRARIVPDS